MKQRYIRLLFFVACLFISGNLFAQNQRQQQTGALHYKQLPQLRITNDRQLKISGPPPLDLSVIAPPSQDICSENAIIPITASNPTIDSPTLLDAVSGGTATYADGAQTGVYFDVSNTGTQLLRVSGIRISAFTEVNTSVDQQVDFHFYRTTSAATAAGNYSNTSAWTNFANGSKAFPPTAASNGYMFDVDFGASGFTIGPGTSVGIYIACDAPDSDFRLGFRTVGTSAGTVSDGTLTVTHLVRATGSFSTDNVPGGFFGDLFYHTGRTGSWERDNFENIIGNIASPEISSGLPIFPIEDILINTTPVPQIAVYTIHSYDVFGTEGIQFASVTVKPLPLNSVNRVGNTLYSDETGALYQWFDCSSGTNIPIDGEISQGFTPTEDGSYGVTVTFENCPINSDCQSVVLGNKGFVKKDVFVVYPNPNHGIFQVSAPLDSKFEMINPLGQVVKNFSIHSVEQSIEIGTLAEGIYYLNGKTPEGASSTQKIILKR